MQIIKRKTIIFTGLCIVGIIVFVVLYFASRPIIQSPYVVANVAFSENESDNTKSATFSEGIAVINVIYNEEDITKKIATEQLLEILSSGSCRRTLKSYSPFSQADVIWEIDLMYDKKPMHILLGNVNIWYEFADRGYYEILDPETIMSALEDLVSDRI